jgi:hypothetical protein
LAEGLFQALPAAAGRALPEPWLEAELAAVTERQAEQSALAELSVFLPALFFPIPEARKFLALEKSPQFVSGIPNQISLCGLIFPEEEAEELSVFQLEQAIRNYYPSEMAEEILPVFDYHHPYFLL